MVPRACIAILAAAAVVAILPVKADDLILPDRAYRNVVLTESDRAFYVRNPEDGSVYPVSKDTLVGNVRIVASPAPERESLYAAWHAKYIVRREAAKSEKQAEKEASQTVQQQRELGARMAQQDVERIAARDVTFHRHDRRWRTEHSDQDALRLLLSGDDDATLKLAAMTMDSDVLNQFVDMRLVEAVKEAWLRQDWAQKDDAQRENALAIVAAVVRREARNSMERDATMAHIQRHLEEWE